MSTRIAIADDHPAFLSGLKHLFASANGIDLIGAARNSTELVDLLSRQRVDVVLTDFSMGAGRYGDGVVLLRFLMCRFPKVRLVVLTGLENARLIRDLLDIGIRVVVSKSEDPELLFFAIRYAHFGYSYLSPAICKLVNAAPSEGASCDALLSRRESEVLRMFCEGMTVEKIGAYIGRSRKTISTQKMSAMRKLGLRNEADLFNYAIANGLIRASRISREDASEALVEQSSASGEAGNLK
ncbi:response regulator transcription factor [Dyella sp.]|uniref:response regulator transcription factor n=1 Tax=Dyella sp. TaxID=1869338 RepID=UPI002ED0CC55